jgi:hypothetical protein
VDRWVIGSALRRGFAEQPLVEVRLTGGLFLWGNARVQLDAGTYALLEQRYALGFGLYL